MLVICNGMPRSASTWSFAVVLELLRRCDPGALIHSGYDENIERFLDSMAPGANHAVVKCHQLDDRGRALSASGSARLIYTWRDPADAVVSCMRMFSHDFDTALRAVSASLELYRFHLRGGAALVIPYDQLLAEPEATVSRIASLLSLGPSRQIVSAVVEATSIERMRERADALVPERLVPVAPGIDHDPVSLLHLNHIRDGSSGYGPRALSPEQLARVEAARASHRASGSSQASGMKDGTGSG